MRGTYLFYCFSSLLAASYTLRTYTELVNSMFAIQSRCPQMTIDTAHERYATPRPCDGCEHYIVTLTGAGLDAPQIFISGALHGDEKLGPNVAVELIRFLCSDRGDWTQLLLKTRRIVIIPIGNPQGYINDWREEKIGNLSVDPNRDFPYETTECMQTSIARCIQELFSEHLFTLSITFHGGDNAIGYMWGAPNHAQRDRSTEAPDARAAADIARVLKNYSKAEIAVGPITDTIYWVKGGLEDYAYAASWENSVNSQHPVKNCSANTYTPYEVTSINENSFRQIMYIVETNSDKHPPDHLLGSPDEILRGDGGLIPQYVRLSLALIDFAQPYIKAHWRLISETTLRVEWQVAGCVTVDSTWIEASLGGVLSKSAVQIGECVWGNQSLFSEEMVKSQDLEFTIYAIVDQAWARQINPDPHVKPQSLFVQARINPDFEVTNQGFSLKYNGQVNSAKMKGYVTF
mmetsp:Transcript_13628/g.25714  ORF Transcript_13628/g.25714 Transcript_13628/m.25714 type:complete len:461 (-) Transcript_13628:54-1436(-)